MSDHKGGIALRRSPTIKGVRNGKILIRLEDGGISGAGLVLRVVIELITAEIPAPRLVVGADEALIADRMEGGGGGGDTDDGVRPSLPGRPVELPNVEATGEADTAAYAVRTLGHWMPMEREWVLLFDEYVERSVVCVPRVLQLHLPNVSPSVRRDETTRQAHKQREKKKDALIIPSVTLPRQTQQKKTGAHGNVYLEVGGMSRSASSRGGLVKSCGMVSCRELDDLLAPPLPPSDVWLPSRPLRPLTPPETF